jgi:flagellar basal body-associated protein FliL
LCERPLENTDSSTGGFPPRFVCKSELQIERSFKTYNRRVTCLARRNSILRIRATFSGTPQSQQRPGIAIAVIVIALIVVLAVASVAAYYLVVASPSSTSLSKSSTRASTSSSSTPRTTAASSATSTTGSSALKTYSVTFNYSLPAGPFGELTFSNNDTVKTYNSVQVASGSFTFSINPANYSGSGSGHGTMTVTTTGFCSGQTTLAYTFQIPDATNLLGGNITVFIGDPTPANFTVPLTCTATANPGSSNGNTFPFLSTYPNEMSVASVPATVTQHLSGNITYSYTISPTD